MSKIIKNTAQVFGSYVLATIVAFLLGTIVAALFNTEFILRPIYTFLQFILAIPLATVLFKTSTLKPYLTVIGVVASVLILFVIVSGVVGFYIIPSGLV